MTKFSRRKFIGSSSALAAAGLGLATEASLAQSAPTSSDASPDYVILNGRIFTSDSSQSSAEAFAVKNDRFIAVGSTDYINRLASRGTEIIDAEGMFIVPGFIDAHSHPSGAGVNELYR